MGGRRRGAEGRGRGRWEENVGGDVRIVEGVYRYLGQHSQGKISPGRGVLGSNASGQYGVLESGCMR